MLSPNLPSRMSTGPWGSHRSTCNKLCNRPSAGLSMYTIGTYWDFNGLQIRSEHVSLRFICETIRCNLKHCASTRQKLLRRLSGSVSTGRVRGEWQRCASLRRWTQNMEWVKNCRVGGYLVVSSVGRHVWWYNWGIGIILIGTGETMQSPNHVHSQDRTEYEPHDFCVGFAVMIELGD